MNPTPLVVKCGGHAAVDHAAVCADVADLARAGRYVVLVHGGSADIDRLAGRLGVPHRRLTGPDGRTARYTDPATLDVVVTALAGIVKPRLLAQLAQAGVPAVGLTGLDAGLLRARRPAAIRAVVDGEGGPRVVRDDHGGRIVEVDPRLITRLLEAGAVPVVSPPALTAEGECVNVDADRAAAALAGALGAETLVLLTGAPGVLSRPGDETSLLRECRLPATGLPPYAQGGMRSKLTAARDALRSGVETVLVADGRGTGPLRAALSGRATRILLDTGRPVRQAATVTTGPGQRR
ncbi:[LysW]-aminoadipate kinase [Streptomyces sp. NPDC093591]|uniref:[LysW]-aminoadipate kinase n=1 Tax=Streptomyces sp. NPDC093591 TaxID=3366044 RepID=UPI0038056797